LLRILLDHLISTIKFTPDGGKITLRLSRPEDDWLIIEVADAGIGIEPDQRELIFEKFYRACTSRLHSTGKTKFMGAGPDLGLYLVRSIIEAHGGYVWVEDNYDSAGQPLGSKFIAQLPRGDVVESAALITAPLYLPVQA
jgi:signal transduction histidine kinase